MSRLKYTTLLAAAVLSFVVAVPFMPFAQSSVAFYHLEADVTSSQRGVAQLFYDTGRGIREEDSARVSIEGGGTMQKARFALPPGQYKVLRLDPLERASTMTFSNAVIRNTAGTVVRTIKPEEFRIARDIDELRGIGSGVEMTLAANGADPIVEIALSPELMLKAEYGSILPTVTRIVLPIFIASILLVAAWPRFGPRVRMVISPWYERLVAVPHRTVLFTGLVALIASSYPVIFLGKSFVSPNFGTILLYEAIPTLPGYKDAETAPVKAADVGAIMWQHIPLSMLQSRALLRDAELPLWNRYNSIGTPLLGQGQSMFGDPFHTLVLATDGAAWAWDLKYLMAKWLLAVGVGLCVLHGTRNLAAAVAITVAMPFIGYFIFRVNHPGFFSTCYAPWILYCWIRISAASNWLSAARWTAGLLLANWTEMNSGTVKEAYMSLLTLNWAGAVILAFSAVSLRERFARFGLATGAGVILLLISAPVWITFADALAQSYTGYNDPRAYQVQPSLALAFFDEVLFRPFWESENVYNGSVNFVVLLGFLLFLANVRQICASNRIALGVAIATLLPAAIIFGVVPPTWITAIPFLGNVAHIDNSFFCPTITLLGVLAGYGFNSAYQRLGGPEGKGDLIVAGLLLAGLTAHYIAFGHTVQRSTYSYWHWGEQIHRSAFVWLNLAALIAASIALGWAAYLIAQRRVATPATLLVAITALTVLLWRHGLHTGTGFKDYVITPPTRVDFHAKSEAIEAIRADMKDEPSRILGIGGNAFHGWTNAYDLEGIGGPDALMNPYYRELQDALGLERIWDWRIYVQSANLPIQKRAFDFLNVRHYLDYRSNQGVLGSMLTSVRMGDLDVYRSDTTWPRAFFTDRLSTYGQARDLARLLSAGDGKPFAAMQTNDANRPKSIPSSPNGRAVTPARNYRLTTNVTRFDIDANGPGVAVLAEAWLSGDFRARLNGEEVPYLRINHAFKGVYISRPGRHTIEFEYRPRRFSLALTLCGLGVVMLTGAATSIWWASRRRSIAAAA